MGSCFGQDLGQGLGYDLGRRDLGQGLGKDLGQGLGQDLGRLPKAIALNAGKLGGDGGQATNGLIRPSRALLGP